MDLLWSPLVSLSLQRSAAGSTQNHRRLDWILKLHGGNGSRGLADKKVEADEVLSKLTLYMQLGCI